jgi:hypothetical protein
VPGLPGTTTYDALLKEWQKLNNVEDLEYFSTYKHPKYDGEPDYVAQVMDDDFFSGIGLTAPFLYDSTIAIGLAACNISSATEVGFDGRTHYNQIVNTKFEGVTGDIVLDPKTGTRSPESGLFDVTNYVETPAEGENTVGMRPVNSYLFSGGQWKELTPHLWNDGTSDIRPGLPDVSVDYNYIGTGLRAAGLVMCCIVLAMCVGFVSFTIYNRKSRTIKASQPIFLLLLIGGIFLMGLSIIPLSFDDEIASDEGCSIACMSVPWLLCTGFSVAFAALLCKLKRINKLFSHAAMRRIKVEPRDVMKSLVIFLLLNLILLSIWTAISPLVWTRQVNSIDQFNRTVSSIGYCSSEWYLPFVILLVVLNLSLLIYCMYQAYHARSISLEFSESEFITKAIAACMLVCFVGIPVMIIVTDQPRAYYFVLTSIIFILVSSLDVCVFIVCLLIGIKHICTLLMSYKCSSLLLFIFVPKVQFHRKKNKAKLGTAIKKSILNSNASRTSACDSNLSTASEGTGGSFDAVDTGIKIYDTPAMRDEMKKENKTLTKENTRLELRVAELESLLSKIEGSAGEVNDEQRRSSVTFSEAEESKEAEEESAV